MGLTNWDEVLPAFDRTFEEMRKIHLQSKETALRFLREGGFLDFIEEQEKEDQLERIQSGIVHRIDSTL